MKYFSLYCTSFILLFCLWLTHPSAVSARVIFEDHFNGQDLSGWKVVQNFQWANQSQPCMFGSSPAEWQLYLQQLGIRIFGPGCFTEIVPLTFQLPPGRSYTYEFDITLPESIDMDRNYTLKYVNPQNAYAMKVLGSRIFLEKLVNGQGWGVNGSSSSYPFQPNQTYHIKNEVNADHTMRVYVNNELILSYTDTPPYLDGGTIGFRASVGAIPNSVTWFDNARVELTDAPPELPVPYVSQRDPSWKDVIYDHTTQTIEKLGCALNSATMVLRYYAVHEISAGTPLTPATLNAWLNAQPDGYIGSGLINWIALTRLARQFHLRNPHVPSLEFARKTADVSTLNTELSARRPPILDLIGHFVVGTAFDSDQVNIRDPYTPLNTSLPVSSIASLRTFTPSFTNLRYMQVIAPSHVRLRAQYQDQTWESFVETAPREEETLHPLESYSVLEIPKPEFGKYTLYVSSSKQEKTPLTIRRYNENAEHVEDRISIYLGQEEVIYIPYSQENTDPVLYTQTPQSFLIQLAALWEKKDIRTPDMYVALRIGAERFINTTQVEEKQRLLHAVEYYLEKYPDHFSPEGKSEILSSIRQM